MPCPRRVSELVQCPIQSDQIKSENRIANLAYQLIEQPISGLLDDVNMLFQSTRLLIEEPTRERGLFPGQPLSEFRVFEPVQYGRMDFYQSLGTRIAEFGSDTQRDQLLFPRAQICPVSDELEAEIRLADPAAPNPLVDRVYHPEQTSQSTRYIHSRKREAPEEKRCVPIWTGCISRRRRY